MSPTVIDVSQVRKTYGRTVAVDDVSFSVRAEEIFGILGPNGAGKTTTVECIIGLRRPDAGTIRVLDLNPERDQDREELHTLVGAQLQVSALPAKLTVRENLDLYRSFYYQPADVAELVSVLGLGDKLDSYYKDLSGGQKQRLAVAVALIGQPKIAVLDEMTTGLDPQARRDTWELIEGIRARGVTILLVTHYMDEAERLCDRVALFDQGRIVALGTPSDLAAEAGGGKHVAFVPSRPFDDRLLADLPDVTSIAHQGPRALVTGKGELVNAVIQPLAAKIRQLAAIGPSVSATPKPGCRLHMSTGLRRSVFDRLVTHLTRLRRAIGLRRDHDGGGSALATVPSYQNRGAQAASEQAIHDPVYERRFACPPCGEVSHRDYRPVQTAPWKPALLVCRSAKAGAQTIKLAQKLHGRGHRTLSSIGAAPGPTSRGMLSVSHSLSRSTIRWVAPDPLCTRR